MLLFVNFSAALAQSNGFLTLPYNDDAVKIQQGYHYVGIPGNHEGLDYIKKNSTNKPVEFDVIAAASGKAAVYLSDTYGYVAIIAHDELVYDSTLGDDVRYYTLYAHLKGDKHLIGAGCVYKSGKNVCNNINTISEISNATKQGLGDFTIGTWVDVERGDKIATASNTGKSPAGYNPIHLHFEVRKGEFAKKDRVDPYGLELHRGDYPGCGTNTTPYLWTECPPTDEYQYRGFSDEFDSSSISNLWNTNHKISGKRWCGEDSGAPNAMGTWVNYNSEACGTLMQTTPYGVINLTNGAAKFSSPPSRTFPYIWSGPPSKESPFPATGDFTLEMKMRFEDLSNFGVGLYARHWENSNPVGNNPPKSLANTAMRVWGDVGGVKARIFDQTITVADPTSDHVYRLELREESYQLFIDGISVSGPVTSTVRPNTLWIGNPYISSLGDGIWTSVVIDYVRVTAN